MQLHDHRQRVGVLSDVQLGLLTFKQVSHVTAVEHFVARIVGYVVDM